MRKKSVDIMCYAIPALFFVFTMAQQFWSK